MTSPKGFGQPRHQVAAEGEGWRCVDCDVWFPTWPPDTEPCPMPRERRAIGQVAEQLGANVVRPHPNGACADLACTVCRRPQPAIGQPVIDTDQYGEEVPESMRRLGAGAKRSDETGLYVRFEPGFGTNVHVGIRKAMYRSGHYGRAVVDRYEDVDGLVLAIGGWARLAELVDEWRGRGV